METAKGLTEVLKKLAGLLAKEELDFCLVGGGAVGMVATPRATEDIDILVLLDEHLEGKVVKASAAARDAGVTLGMNGKEAVLTMNGKRERQ